ncbi:DUF1326 domain-containing protein [Ramlibacter sp. 2FC]|uniref:DUF1326 domain-containing protein n=1 Tax=Ramlibacter sp. 2FC TaxID=2502188 RepID=UPI0010F7C9C7|nr:DUF1326 domain-containing protein [Ramlibacter sp. 2FC]
MAYQLEGRLLEVCTCKAICPCWVGEDPDLGHCKGLMAWHFDKGTVNGVDVSGRTLAAMAYIPGNVLQGNWSAAIYVDEKSSPQQEQAMLDVFTGKLGGPVADMAKLIGTVVSVERVPIDFDVQGGKGTLKVGEVSFAEMESFSGATGATTTLNDTVFSTVPGAPAFVGKATRYRAKNDKLNIDVDIKGYNSIQSVFKFVA